MESKYYQDLNAYYQVISFLWEKGNQDYLNVINARAEHNFRGASLSATFPLINRTASNLPHDRPTRGTAEKRTREKSPAPWETTQRLAGIMAGAGTPKGVSTRGPNIEEIHCRVLQPRDQSLCRSRARSWLVTRPKLWRRRFLRQFYLDRSRPRAPSGTDEILN